MSFVSYDIRIAVPLIFTDLNIEKQQMKIEKSLVTKTKNEIKYFVLFSNKLLHFNVNYMMYI
jgi:hypothetical protein